MAGNIKGITIEFRGDTTKLSKSINQIRRESKSLDREIRDIDRALKFNPTSLDLWKQKQTVLNQKIRQTRTHLAELKAAEKQMRANGVDQNSAEFRELQREIIKTENQLRKAEAELRRFGSAKLQALGAQFQQVGQKMQQIGRSMTQYVTVPLTIGGTVAAKKFAEVDKTMQLVNSTMGNTASQAALIDKAMKQAASNSTYSMDDAAKATLNFARAGLSAEQAADALAPAMNLAAGEGGNLDTVSAGLVATINGFGDTFDNASQYADVFANACNNSALDVDSLADSMKIAAPVFKAAGYSVNDAALYMGVMANKGIPASEAANALKTGLARLVEPSKQGKEWLDKLGVSVTNADGTMKDSVQVQSELHGAFGKLSDSEKIAAASAIFGKNQMSKWLALIDTAPSEVQELNADLQEMGTTERMATAMMSGFGGSIEKLKSSLDVAATSLGQALAPIIGKVVQGFQWLVDKFNELSPTAQRVVAVIGVIVAAIGPLLVVLGTLATAIGSLMSVGPALLGAFSGIAPVIAIIAGIAVAFVALWKTSKKFRTAVIKGVGQVKEAFDGVWKSLKPMFAQLASAVKGLIKAAGPIAAKIVPLIAARLSVLIKVLGLAIKITVSYWTIVVKAVTVIMNAARSLLNWLPGAVKGALSSVLALVKSTIQAIKTGWAAGVASIKAVWNGLKASASSVWNGIKASITAAVTSVVNSVKSLWNGAGAAVKSIWNGIKSAALSVWNGIKSVVSNAANSAKSAAVNAFNSLKSGISSAVSGVKSAVSNAFSSLKSKMTAPFTSARDTIKSIISKIKGIFPVHIGKIFSGLKLPHFKVSGGKAPWGIDGKGSLPSFSVSWYKKGGIFNEPSLIGIGEAGSEAVVPLDKLWEKMDAIADASRGGGNNVVINVYAAEGMDVNALAQKVKRVIITEENRRRLAW